MSIQEELENYYQKIIKQAVSLNTNYLFARGNFRNETLKFVKKELQDECKKLNLVMSLVPDGEDTVLSIETKEREFGAYIGIDDSYPKYVISTDEEDYSRDGIKHINIFDFLMNEEF